MTYFLGRDIHAAITTEHKLMGISVVAGSGNAYADNVKIAEVSTINATTDIATTAAHGLSDGDPVNVTGDSAAHHMGLTAGTTYFVNAPSTTTLSFHATYADAIAGTSKEALTDSNASTTNITRELTGANTSGTLIKNRQWPQYDGTGQIDTIVGDTTTAEGIEQATAADLNTITDLVGIDVTMGTTDEDVSYFGQKSALKSEIKNEVTVTFTRKKSDPKYEILFNKARCGVLGYTTSSKNILDVDGATPLASSTLPALNTVDVNNSDASVEQPSRNFGYRVHLMLKTSGEVISFQNCCITGYSVSLNPDGIQEETIEFYGYMKPKVTNAAIGYITATAQSEL
jgi:hypothetical protein